MNPKENKSAISRRNILKNAGLAAVGVGVSTATFAQETKQVIKGPLEGKVAFITGAARGIGRAIAIALAKQGADISLFDIAGQIDSVGYPMSRPMDLDETGEMIEVEGRKCVTKQGDVRSSQDLMVAVHDTIVRLGRIDIVVANAGIANMGMIDQMDDQAWDDVVNVNLTGVARTLKATIPELKKRDSGKIVVISSVSGRGGSPGMSAYAASKWGVIGLTKSVAREVGPANITCNAICPTAIATPMIENDAVRQAWSPDDPTSAGVDKNMRKGHALPVGMLDPIEIANAAVFLCSDQAKAITGIAMDVAAGSTAKNNA